LLLFCLSVGACVALPMSGPATHRLGAARVVWLGSIAVGLGLLGLTAGLVAGTVWPAAVGLAITGAGLGNWDVAMNIEGAEVVRRRGRSLMPRLHAAFSIGTVAGGGLGVASAGVGLPLAVQTLGIALLAPLSMTIATRSFLPVADPEPGSESAGSGGLEAWREPRTLLIGLLTLAFSFVEGTANDWIAVAFVDGHHTSEVLGAVSFGTFVVAMTVGRLSGGTLLDRFGRVAVLRGSIVLAMVGVLLVMRTSSAIFALAGALLWGLGAALGFPVGVSAAADDPARAAAQVSVVSSISYTSFLAGPPLIGFLAEHTGILRALVVVVAVVILGGLVTSAVRPPVEDV
ncbi:MAG: MFS transporter, partial [Pseudonocardiaceae bacterium]